MKKVIEKWIKRLSAIGKCRAGCDGVAGGVRADCGARSCTMRGNSARHWTMGTAVSFGCVGVIGCAGKRALSRRKVRPV